MDKTTAVYAVIEAIIFLIPLGTLIWKMARLSAKVDQNEKDITEVKADHKESIEVLSTKIDSLLGSVNEIKISIAEIRAYNKEDK